MRLLKCQGRWRDVFIIGRLALAADPLPQERHMARARAAPNTAAAPLRLLADAAIRTASMPSCANEHDLHG